MKKNELRNGDIVILRDGAIGFYRVDEDVIIYQKSGYDSVDDMFDDDLRSFDGEAEFDIMQVYRAESGVISFTDYEDGDLIFERDEAWIGPEKEGKEKEGKNPAVAVKVERKDRITVIAQAFYGNRTLTEITPDEMDAFILGYIGGKILGKRKIDRTVIRIPESDNLVMIYNRYEEEERRQEMTVDEAGSDFRRKPLAEIPEEKIRLYSRCIVCRMDADGTFQSLQEEDFPKFMKYLAK